MNSIFSDECDEPMLEYTRAINPDGELNQFPVLHIYGPTKRGGSASVGSAATTSAGGGGGGTSEPTAASDDADAAIYKEMLGTDEETFFGKSVPSSATEVEVEDEDAPASPANANADPRKSISVELAAIRDYTETEEREMAELERDTSTMIVNGPDKPIWYAECARRALEALTIDNVVVVAYVDEPIHCATVVARRAQYGLKLNSSSYAAMMHRQLNPPYGGIFAQQQQQQQQQRSTNATSTHRQPTNTPIGVRQKNQISATGLIFPTGKITTTGPNTFETGVWATRCSVDIIAGTADENGAQYYPDLRIRRIGIKNVVASTVLFFGVDLEAFFHAHPRFVHNIAVFWKGIVIELKNMGLPEYEQRTATLLVYASGAVVFTSMRGRADVIRVFRLIYPLLAPFALPGTERWRTPLLQKKASKRDGTIPRNAPLVNADAAETDSNASRQQQQQKLQLLEQTTDVAIGAASGDLTTTTAAVAAQFSQLMRAPNKRKNQNEAGVARNILALDSWQEHATKKAKLDEERASLLASLRATKTKPGRRAPEMKTRLLDSREAKLMSHEQTNE